MTDTFYPLGDAPPLHSASCTRMQRPGDPEAVCVGWHCPYCGGPSSSQGHPTCVRRKREAQAATVPYA